MSPTPRDLFDAANDWDDRRGAPGFDDVGRVIAIVASSRGGSSLLYELLSTRSGAISIGGEHTALYKRNGLTRGANGSDVLPDDVPFDRDRLSRDFAALLGVHEQPLRRPPTDELVGSFIRRLALQWPHACLDPHHIESAVHDSMSASASTESAFRATIATLRTRGCPVNPVFYDGSDTKRPPGHVPPFDAPGVEEPPFVLPTGRRAPSTDEARSGVLVLKSSVDAYRLPLLRRMFPTADVRVLHLTRNPAASVNGLYDGWRDRGFFSYDVSAESPLSIAGYSELGEFATRWWNFDIPPRWRDVARSPLEVVRRSNGPPLIPLYWTVSGRRGLTPF